MRAYALDLRERVVAAVQQGISRRAAAATFAVRRSSIKRWPGTARTGATRAPGRLPRFDPHHLDVLRTRLEAAPDATLDAHVAWWNQQHPDRPVARATLDRAITRRGWSQKKRCTPPSVMRPARAAFRARLHTRPADAFVVVDEGGGAQRRCAPAARPGMRAPRVPDEHYPPRGAGDPHHHRVTPSPGDGTDHGAARSGGRIRL